MKEIMNPKWEDADDCEDKIRQFTDKTEITNQKWKKEKWQTCITTTNITVPRSLAHPLDLCYTQK